MRTININWLGCCRICGSKEHEVKTEEGTYKRLLDGDEVKCKQCGLTGTIFSDDGGAEVDWDTDKQFQERCSMTNKPISERSAETALRLEVERERRNPQVELLKEKLAAAESHIAALEQQLEAEKSHRQAGWKEAHEQEVRAELAEQQLAAERARVVTLPKELREIGNNIRTQDNRITDQPMFVVFEKQEIIGSDEHSPSRIVWCRDGEEVSESKAKRLEALHQDFRPTDGYDRYAMQEIDVFVTACFTEQGCKDFLIRDGHNHRLPYIYACGSYRNHEYQTVRDFLVGLPVEGE